MVNGLKRHVQKPSFLLRKNSYVRLNLLQHNHISSAQLMGLAISVLSLIVVSTDYLLTTQRLDKIYQSINEDVNKAKLNPSFTEEEITNAQTGMNALATPWGNLFIAMENVANERVQLLELQPDAQKKTVRITAETTDVYEMLEYMRAMAAQSHIHNLKLLHHKVNEGDTDQQIKFTLEAEWG